MRKKIRKLFGFLICFLPLAKRDTVSDCQFRFSKAVLQRRDHAAANGRPMTAIIFGRSGFPADEEDKHTPNYVSRRVFFIVMRICIGQDVLFYWLDKEFLLLVEVTLDEAERISEQIISEFKEEDIRVACKTICLTDSRDGLKPESVTCLSVIT